MTAERPHPPTTNRVCCCSLKAAAITVGLIELLLCVIAVYGLWRNFSLFGGYYLFWFIVGVISILIIAVSIVFLFLAIKKQKARWLLPHLSAQIFLILWLFIVALVVAILLLFGAYRGIRNLIGQGDYQTSDGSTEALGYMIIIVYTAIGLLECFFFWIIYKLYLHFKEYQLLHSGKIDVYAAGDQAYISNDWYIPPKNQNAYGGSPSAGDVYPYEPPVTPPPQRF